MKIAIMQPYFLPYLGYFQLLNHVDYFIVYDKVQYSKKGWFNKNSFLMNGNAKLFSIPIKKDSDYLHVSERELALNAEKEILKILGQIKSAYSKSKYFNEVYPLLRQIFLFEDKNLFRFIFNAIQKVHDALDLNAELVISSNIEEGDELKGQDRVISLCKRMKADEYINPEGGINLYDSGAFKESNIELKFLKKNLISYEQFGNAFIDNLSIIDVLMFNGIDKTKALLDEFQLFKKN